MSCFDMMADEDFEPRKDDWLLKAARLRRKARNNDDLTKQRSEFLQEYAIDKPNNYNQGEAKSYRCFSPALAAAGLDTALRSKEDVLAAFPRYSVRLLLRFRLLAPLLTKDDDPFYLFDNPARKDHVLGLPYLSAASLKGLSADAYQRAFPGAKPWGDELGKDDPARTRAFRQADPSVLRLFGIADDGGETTEQSRSGRLHFSPVWFDQLQMLVMNPGNPEKAIGRMPIQFEAVASGQQSLLEVVYFNPYGARDSDEGTVRDDLARWLASVAVWWPALGLGAKRLAGYGAIRVESVELQAVGWSGMAVEETAGEVGSDRPARPKYYADYLGADGQPLAEEQIKAKLVAVLEAEDTKIAQLDHDWRHAQGKTQSRARKKWEKAKKNRQRIETEMQNQYRQVLEYWQEHGREQPEQAVAAGAPVLASRQEQGENSWLNLARWIAEYGDD